MRLTVRLLVAGVGLVTVGLPALASAPAQAAPITVAAQVAAQTWTVAPAPATTTSVEQDSAARVSCVTSAFCMSVGSQGNFVGFGTPVLTTLTQEWNGTSWATVPSPNPATASNAELTDVSCISTSFCMAVGWATFGSMLTNSPLAEQWNGTQWTISTLTGPATSSGFTAVSCTSTTWCMAVGFPTLAAQWNGVGWTTSTVKSPADATNISVTGLSCSGTNFCMAVGLSSAAGMVDGNSFIWTTLAEQWTNNSWAIVSSPNLTTVGENELTDVSCIGASFCTAVGDGFLSNTSSYVDLIESWNGTTWAMSAAPTFPTGDGSALQGINCFSWTSCTAVGTTDGNSAGSQIATQAATWNGQAWTGTTTPNVSQSPPGSFLSGVDCLTDWACVAVGGNDGPGDVGTPYDMWAPIARSGYRFVASDGGIFAFGTGAPYLGSLGGVVLNKPIVGMAVMPAGDGYYLVASDGGVFTFGSAQFYGSTGSIHLNRPIVGMAVTADGGGYWLVASDGGIFAFGDATFYGSTGAVTLNKPIVGMAATPNGFGYYLVASDGGIFAFGNAVFAGSTGAIHLNKPIVGMGEITSGDYYLVASDGGIFTFPSPGGPPFLGSTGSLVLNKPIVGMAPALGGYYLVASDGGIFTFPNSGVPPFLGSTGSLVLDKPIVGMTA